MSELNEADRTLSPLFEGLPETLFSNSIHLVLILLEEETYEALKSSFSVLRTKTLLRYLRIIFWHLAGQASSSRRTVLTSKRVIISVIIPSRAVLVRRGRRQRKRSVAKVLQEELLFVVGSSATFQYIQNLY